MEDDPDLRPPRPVGSGESGRSGALADLRNSVGRRRPGRVTGAGNGGPCSRSPPIARGPNMDAHTIEIPAADQTHAGSLVGVDSLKTAHYALLDSQQVHDPIPRLHYELRSAPPIGQPHSQSVKNRVASAVPRPCHRAGYAPSLRVRQIIRESENPPAKFQKPSVAVVCF